MMKAIRLLPVAGLLLLLLAEGRSQVLAGDTDWAFSVGLSSYRAGDAPRLTLRRVHSGPGEPVPPGLWGIPASWHVEQEDVDAPPAGTWVGEYIGTLGPWGWPS